MSVQAGQPDSRAAESTAIAMTSRGRQVDDNDAQAKERPWQLRFQAGEKARNIVGLPGLGDFKRANRGWLRLFGLLSRRLFGGATGNAQESADGCGDGLKTGCHRFLL